ncbi:hypothetical protein [Actinoplanes sp. NPDC049599]|uniref:hypothetical protein n=1 Tax=Actinoplanes sp. NPDC049599 TaxID=3363903 RepID=UPI00379F0CC0
MRAVTAREGQDLALTLRDPAAVRAADALLDLGIKLRRTEAGTVVVPAEARREAETLAKSLGVRFTAASRGSAGTPFGRPVDELLARVGVVTRGATGAAFNAAAGLLPATAVTGRGDANGVVVVRTTGAVPGADALPHTVVHSPLWFTGSGFTVEQRYAAGPLIAGDWLPTAPGAGGPEQAAGQASAVSGRTARGGKAVLFGTEPLFRAYPKVLYAEFARARYWSAG